MFFDKKKISFLGLLVTIVLLISIFGIILSVAERDPSEELILPIEKENQLQRQIGAKHMSDTGQSSEAPEFLPQPYIDPYTKRWVCPEPVKVVDDVHVDAELEDAHPGQNDSDHSLSHQNDTIDFENEISNEVDAKDVYEGRSSELAKNLLSLDDALLLDNIEDKNQFGKIFNNITGLKISLPKFPSKKDPLAFGATRAPFMRRGPPVSDAIPAFCQPELTTVKLDLEEEPNVVYIPECTRIERCGGCCSHELLSCQPSSTENVTMIVKKAKIDRNNPSVAKNVFVQVVRHKTCKCDCRIKKKDCNVNQIYLPNECRCVCNNTVELERNCNRMSSQRFWDSNLCRCRCKHVTECSTGLLFDHNTCSCSILEADHLKPLIPFD